MLTLVDYPSVAGINGVEWDAVELPSQFMENWCWEKPALDLVSGHYQTGEPLPAAWTERLQQSRNFQAAMQLARQLEFSLFDFRLHLEYDPENAINPQALIEEVREQVAVVKPPPYNRFQNGFSHIFAGGYAAGYYSYKWAEVLSADAFSKFEENGIFDSQTGRDFMHNILERGGSEKAMDLFIRFRGRKPQIESLLKHHGIAA
jgi:oligopeptidase A